MKYVYSLNTLEKVVHNHLIPAMQTATIFTLTGSLGAGKTTLVGTWLSACGVRQPITSPTFTYVQVYHNDKKETFYHFDLYRLVSCDEFIAMGFDEYLVAPNSYSLIEWPAVIAPLLESQDLKKRLCPLILSYLEDNFETREISIGE